MHYWIEFVYLIDKNTLASGFELPCYQVQTYPYHRRYFGTFIAYRPLYRLPWMCAVYGQGIPCRNKQRFNDYSFLKKNNFIQINIHNN